MLNYKVFEPDVPPLGLIVALHGLMESIDCIADACHKWALQGWRVCAIELRGHGQSPRWHPDGRHPGDVMTDDVNELLLDVLAQLAPEGPVVFYGHSAGGGIAAAASVAGVPWARRVAGVLLEDPFWRLPVSAFQEPDVAEAASQALLAVKRLDRRGREARVKKLWPLWPDDEVAAVAEAQRNADEKLVRNGNVIPTRPWPQLLDVLQESSIPVLVVTGTDRIGMTQAHQELLARKGVRVAIVEGASHFVRRDKPVEFAAITEDFLAGIGRVSRV